MTKTLKIEGMSCGHCAAAVTKSLEALKGVGGVRVDLAAKTAVLQITGTAPTDEELRAAVDDAGYDLVGIA